ncbi:MAG: 4-hydroxy-tetrahydrodipicolinate reductase, partial [Limisphaerales bacterium]
MQKGLKIGLLGYGKMGQTIDSILSSSKTNDEVVWKANSQNAADIIKSRISEADVIIEFSRPERAVSNFKAVLDAGIPLVTGTTGWLNELDAITAYCTQKDGAFFHAPNFSIGVNLFFELNEWFADRMRHFAQYEPSLSETHHTSKLDSPSGTGLHLANQILALRTDKNKWVEQLAQNSNELALISQRVPDVPGTHEVLYESEEDQILLRHLAYSRAGFAKGAIAAARWLVTNT